MARRFDKRLRNLLATSPYWRKIIPASADNPLSDTQRTGPQ